MIDIRTEQDLKDIPILEDPMVYIYIFLNDAGKIKIGKTKNIHQRYQSLCGSNGAGNTIISTYVSPCSYLYTIETVMHDKFSRYRIPNTEWFYNKSESSGVKIFTQAIVELELLFSSTTYQQCNSLRKQAWEKRKKKEKGDNNDH